MNERIAKQMIDYTNELANECPVTLDHALTHLHSAKIAEQVGDREQAVHDADVAAKILHTYVSRRWMGEEGE